MEIYIVRHGETIWNAEKRLQGRADIELNENGIELAKLTGQALMDTPIDKIFSSPLKRAYKTAQLIRNGRNIEIEIDERLKEICFGELEGSNASLLLKDETNDFHHFFKRPDLYRAAKDGETLEELCKRAGEFMEDKIMPLENQMERVMIVAHGALNKGIMTYIKKHEIKDFWSGGLQKNCNVIIVNLSKGKFDIIDETKVYY